MRVPASAALCGALVSLGFGLLPGVASAAEYDLSFASGSVSVNSFDSGGTHFDQYIFDLGNLDSALTLVAGDKVKAAVNFVPEVFQLPHSDPVYLSTFIFALGNSSGAFPDVDTGSSGTVSFMRSGIDLLTVGSSTGTHGQISFGAGYSTLPLPAMDQAVLTFTIDTLSQPGSVDHAYAYFTNFSPAVPEPTSALMLLCGLGMASYAARRRRAAD